MLPLLAIFTVIHTSTHSATAAEKAKTWTPKEIVTEGTKLCDNSTERLIEFQVASIRTVPTVDANGKTRNVPHLVPAGGFSRFGGFSAPLEAEYLATLTKKGITDLESHFVGREMTINGIVRASALDVFGRKTIWSFYVTLRSPEQIRKALSLKNDH